jgi:hypothetical protein
MIRGMTQKSSDIERLVQFAAKLREAADDADTTPGVSPELPALLRRLADERDAAAAILGRSNLAP